MLSAVLFGNLAYGAESDPDGTDLTLQRGWVKYLGRGTGKLLDEREQRDSGSSSDSSDSEKTPKVKKLKVTDRLDIIEG